MKRNIDINDYESTIDNKVRKMKEPSEEMKFDIYNSISVYHCSVYGNNCSYILHKYGIDNFESYVAGHISAYELANDYLDYQIANTDDPLKLAYYWHCYKEIGKNLDYIPGINNLKGRVALISVFNNIDGSIGTAYSRYHKDNPYSVITFKDKETAIDWYEESYSDIQIFAIPAKYVDTFEYSLTPYREHR